MKRILLPLLGTALAFLGCHPEPAPETKATAGTLTLAVASSMQFAMEDLAAEYRTLHPEATLQATYGSSGNFFAQLQNEAPFDLFLAADMDYVEELATAGLALDDQVSCYAIGGLVLWVPLSSPIAVEKLGMQSLLDPAIKKIAIANPKFAPYGAAAVAAMKALGVYEQVERKLVMGENISQTAQFVQSGAADIAFLALSHTVAPRIKDQGRSWEVPAGHFPAIRQGAIILKRTPHVAAARAFRDFLLSEAGGRVLTRNGFQRPAN